MEQLLKMEGITKSFFGVGVLKGVDFDLEHGEVHVLLGENGAGKSTLMKILSGAYQLDSGAITLDGQPLDLSAYDPKSAEDLGIVSIYQNFHLIPHLSVAENLALPTFTHGQRLDPVGGSVRPCARGVAKSIHFDIDLRAKVRDLPVSQKQMLEIAIALSKNARVIIMDEPTAALSRKETETLFKAIADIKARGIGIIYISHKLEEVKQVGDRITVLRNGARVAHGRLQGRRPRTDRQHDDRQGVCPAATRPAGARRATRSSGSRGCSAATCSAPVSFASASRKSWASPAWSGRARASWPARIFGVDRLSGGAAYLSGRPVRLDSPESGGAGDRLSARGPGFRWPLSQPGGQGECLDGAPDQVEGDPVQHGLGEKHGVSHGRSHGDSDRRAVAAGEIPERRQQAEGRVRQMALGAGATC